MIDIEAKPEITFDDFMKMQFQVGEIIACEEVKKSKKLLCSQVKIGSQVKQIVSGIKAHYTPEEMVGKKSNGACELKTGETGRCFIRGNASLCRRCRRKSCINDTGKRDAGGGRNLLRLCPTACNKSNKQIITRKKENTMSKIRIGIVGYGNIGRGVELAIERNDDMELVAVVTRRNPEDVRILTEGVKKVHLDDVLSLKEKWM